MAKCSESDNRRNQWRGGEMKSGVAKMKIMESENRRNRSVK
jgi:hypothetical protein